MAECTQSGGIGGIGGTAGLQVKRVVRGAAVVVHAGDVDMGTVDALHTELVAALAAAVPACPRSWSICGRSSSSGRQA